MRRQGATVWWVRLKCWLGWHWGLDDQEGQRLCGWCLKRLPRRTR